MSNLRQTPLTCSGHTRSGRLLLLRLLMFLMMMLIFYSPLRPVVFLAFSEINADGIYYSISACKDGENTLVILVLSIGKRPKFPN